MGFFSSNSTTKSLKVNLDALSSEDIIILVMGPPGAGKSTFINNATQSKPGSPVGHGLGAETIKIQAFKVTRNNRHFVFIDTPGFDDANSTVVTEQAILNLVSSTLSKSKVKLACIIYLHKISDNRLTLHKARENYSLFETLLGKDMEGGPYKKILLATTMWMAEQDEAKHQARLRRQKELQSQYWNGVEDNRQTEIQQFHDTPNYAWELIKGVDGMVV